LPVANGGTGTTSTTFVNLTTNVTGTLPIANGGTNNAALAVTAGGALYTDGSKLVNVGAGTSGQVLTSAGASAPTWTTPSSGAVVQVKTASTTTQQSFGSGSYNDLTGMSVSITPTSSSNKILILIGLWLSNDTDTVNVYPRILRGSTQIAVNGNDTAGFNGYGGYRVQGSGYGTWDMSYMYVDSPATTSATTYKIQAAANGGTTYMNRAAAYNYFLCTSTITVMEITP
jgi:hypothetical protein